MGAFSIWHWLIVLVIVVLVFGTKKLKNMGSDVGGAVKNFKDAVKDEKDGVEVIEADKTVSKRKSTIDVDAD
jgi:sec-independent protein translocase protein TatA